MNERDIGEGANRQWNKIKFRVNSSIYRNLVPRNGGNTNQWGEKRSFNKWSWENWIIM